MKVGKKRKLKRNHYQERKSSFRLDENMYRAVRYMIRYVYLNLVASPVARGDPEDIIKKPTEIEAVHNVIVSTMRDACEDAWRQIPAEYRPYVYEHIINDVSYDYIDCISENTMKKYVQQYIFFVAKNLGYV